MLVLSRKPGESIRIGADVYVTVVDASGGKVRLGIAAPAELKIIRDELLDDESSRRELASSRQ